MLIKPHITEKATRLAEGNQHVFEVGQKATKGLIKQAVEKTYGVKVLRVRTVRIPKKKRGRGRLQGFKKGYKKAVVKLKQGEKIELLPK